MIGSIARSVACVALVALASPGPASGATTPYVLVEHFSTVPQIGGIDITGTLLDECAAFTSGTELTVTYDGQTVATPLPPGRIGTIADFKLIFPVRTALTTAPTFTVRVLVPVPPPGAGGRVPDQQHSPCVVTFSAPKP